MPDTGLVLANRYRLAYRIAAGGVGEVWRALDTVLERPVAVKLLHPAYAEHPETLARFRAEARHAGSLSHPGIAHVYDYGDADPPLPPYLVMEAVDGPSLAGLLAAGPLDPARTMDVIAQAAAGLAAAHRAGLVHRDIKPANLLIAPGGTVKITDFGIAYAAGSAPLTRTGMLVGTPAYLAPERAAGAVAGPASDLYSLGIVAFECLTGTVPFRGGALEIMAAHQGQPLPALPPAVPAAVTALVTELTARDPAGRPAGAAELASRAARLRDALAGSATARLPAGAGTLALPASGPAPAPATRTGLPLPGRQARLSRRQWAVLALAAAAMAAGLAGALAGSLAAAPAPRPHPAVTASSAARIRATTAPAAPARRPGRGHGQGRENGRGHGHG